MVSRILKTALLLLATSLQAISQTKTVKVNSSNVIVVPSASAFKTANNISSFSNSAELAALLSDETGNPGANDGEVVFNKQPLFENYIVINSSGGADVVRLGAASGYTLGSNNQVLLGSSNGSRSITLDNAADLHLEFDLTVNDSGHLVFGSSTLIIGSNTVTATGTGTMVLDSQTQTLLDKTLSTGTAVSASIAFSDGVKQTFNPNGTNAGFNFGAHTANPSSAANGDAYYNSTDNALRARINGAWVDLGGGGGGSAAELDLVAWVEADGNDTTGTVGDPSKSYLTPGEAWNDGARFFILGSGTFSLTKAAAMDIAIIGQGINRTNFSVTSSAGAIQIIDVGHHSATITAITTSPTGFGVAARNCYITDINTYGPNGADTSGSFENAGDGSTGGSVTLEYCEVTGNIHMYGGNGGTASGGDSAAGNGGAGGELNARFSSIGTVNNYGGSGGSGSFGAGTTGVGGSSTLYHGTLSTLNSYGSDAGQINAFHQHIGNLDVNFTGTGSIISGKFISIDTVAGSPSISANAYYINGSGSW